MKEQNEISEHFIDTLFNSKYFTHKFCELQIQYNEELFKSEHSSSNQNSNHLHHFQNITNLNTSAILGQLSEPKTTPTKGELQKSPTQLIEEDEVINEISDILLFNLKESMFKETNTILESKLSIISLTEEIESIKQCLSKISHNSFLTKTSTQESISPEKDEKYKENDKSKNNKHDSIFLNGDEEESFISGNGKKLFDDRPSNFSFMSSFLNENKFAQDEEILNERINASISKVESSIEDRISQVEKEFARRIEQVMKTIKNLITMINEHEANPKPKLHHNPYPHQHQQANHTKSSILLPKSEINPSESTPNIKTNNNESNVEISTFLTTPKNNKEEKNLLNISSNKLTSFFKLRKN